MQLFICHNGAFADAGETVLTAQNRSYKWGDGLFETIKVYRQKILLPSYHFERLFKGLHLLKIKPGTHFTPAHLAQNILHLCSLNNCSSSARVRLSIYRESNGGAGYNIEAIPLDDGFNKWDNEGYRIDVYKDVRKSTDILAQLKTANYLPYVMAGLYAKETGIDDCLVLNHQGSVCDSSKANVFILKDNILYTPALHQGCISGIMRRHIIEAGKARGCIIRERTIIEEDIHDADEIFLTNAIMGIRWVKAFAGKEFSCVQTAALYHSLVAPLFDL